MTALRNAAERMRAPTGVIGWGQIDAVCTEVALQVVWGQLDTVVFSELDELMRHGNLVPIVGALESINPDAFRKLLPKVLFVLPARLRNRLLRVLGGLSDGAGFADGLIGLDERRISAIEQIVEGRFDARDRFLARINERLRDPSTGSLRAHLAEYGDEPENASQLVHWLFATRATLAGGVAYTLSLLAAHPAAMRDVLRELRHFGSVEELHDTIVAGKGAKKLTAMEGAIFEALRLFPVTPILIRNANGVVDAANTLPTDVDQYLIHMVANNRDPRFVGDECDPNAFHPGRWAARKGADLPMLAGLDNYHRAPLFGSDNKECPGRNVALLLIKAMLGQFLFRYDLTGVENRTPGQPALVPGSIPVSFDQFGIRLHVRDRGQTQLARTS